LDISIEELQLFIDCAGYGLGEGAPPCYIAFEKVIPSILTHHKMTYIDSDNGVKVLLASEFFSEHLTSVATQAYKSVFDKVPSQDDLLKACNYIPANNRDFISELKADNYTVEMFEYCFEKAKAQLTEERRI
jgi:hypothetical protein